MYESLPLVVIAMEAEAAPVRKKLGLVGEGKLLADGVSARLWLRRPRVLPSAHRVLNTPQALSACARGITTARAAVAVRLLSALMTQLL